MPFAVIDKPRISELNPVNGRRTLPPEEQDLEHDRRYSYGAIALSDFIGHRSPPPTARTGIGDSALWVIYDSSIEPQEQILPPKEDELRNRFRDLTERWHAETDFLSSVTDIVLNINYQKIIGIGRAALPLIQNELKESDGHWFWALEAITGVDVVPEVDRGNIRRMTQAWLQWLENNI